MKLYLIGHNYKYAVEQMLLTLFPTERPEYPDEQPDEEADYVKIALTEGDTQTTAVCRIRRGGAVSGGWAGAPTAAFTDPLEKSRLQSQAVKLAPDLPNLAEALIVQGEALIILARYDDATLVLDRALLASPGEDIVRRAGMLKADALFAMGADDDARYSEALTAYRALADDVGLTPSARLAVAFKIGRTLEKLRKAEEAADQYYSEVVLAYERARANGAWLDDSARAFFARAAFALADYYESKGLDRQARKVLRHVSKSDVPAADEARKRIARLEAKGR